MPDIDQESVDLTESIERKDQLMKKIVTVVGARPQFIKAAVLSRIIRSKGALREVLVHTGQHFDDNMSEVFFRELEIPRPDHNLEVNSAGHGAMTGRMMEKLEPVLEAEQPDLVLVYGDTNSTLAGALVAKKMGIPVAHVEAGLRSHNMGMPEEINRVLTDRISDLLFCPTGQAVANLEREGFGSLDAKVILSGDIMKDSVRFFRERPAGSSGLAGKLGLTRDKFVLATIHREDNTSNEKTLRAVFEGLETINKSLPVVLPLHPRTRKAMEGFGISTSIRLIEPLGYFEMQELLGYCALVVTDSGGLQKEAYFHKKPCLVVREETEWTELVEAGMAELSGADPARMYEAFQSLRGKMLDFDLDLYGRDPGESIYREIADYLRS